MTVNDRIHELMIERGWTPNHLAELIDISPNSVYRWFKEDESERTVPSVENIVKTIAVCSITPMQFLQGFELPDLTQEQKELLSTFSSLENDEKLLIKMLIEKFNNEKTK